MIRTYDRGLTFLVFLIVIGLLLTAGSFLLSRGDSPLDAPQRIEDGMTTSFHTDPVESEVDG